MYHEMPPADDRNDETPRWHIVEFVPLPPQPAAGSYEAPNQAHPSLIPSEPNIYAASGPALPEPPPRWRTVAPRPLFEELDALVQANTSELEALAARREGEPAAARAQPDRPTYTVARELVASRRDARRRWRSVRRLLWLGLILVIVAVALVIVVEVGGPLLFHHASAVRIGPSSLFAR